MTPQTPRDDEPRYEDPIRPDSLRTALDRKERERNRHAARINRRTADRRH